MGERNQQLKAEVVDGRLVISIGIDLLAYAISYGDRWGEDWVIRDPDGFAAEVGRYAIREKQDGETPMHRLLDRAAMDTVEDGHDSVRLPGDSA